jgi:penicillin-binding protein 1A
MRQPGSAFKPVVFAAAFEAGMDPATAFRDRPIDIEGWTPENYGGDYRGRITIADALKRSVNTIAVQVGAEIGADAIAEMALRLGITTPLNRVPALSLGSGEVRLIDLVGVYAAFANDGRRTVPALLTEVRNARGDLLWAAPERTPGAPVIEVEQARWMSTMMQSVMTDGTGTRARLSGRPAAGKTGTSQNSRDAWFVGYTGQLAAGVWVGNDDDTPTQAVTGGQLPAQIWRDFMTAAHQGRPVVALAAPAPQRRTEREETLAAFYSDLSERFSAMAAPSRP